MDAPYHRKIDLQSPSDLTYLLENIKAAAREKIDLAIPPSAAPAGEDAYRTRVEELVNEYIIQTLTLALPSLNINGLDPSPSLLQPHPPTSTSLTSTSLTSTSLPLIPSSLSPSSEPNYEPYDPRLAAHLRDLYATFDDESTKIATLRREAPAKAAGAWRVGLQREMEVERERERLAREEEEREGMRGGERELDLGTAMEGWMSRRGEVEGMWKVGVEGLGDLGGVTGVLARLERAERAMGIVEEGRGGGR